MLNLLNERDSTKMVGAHRRITKAITDEIEQARYEKHVLR